MKNFGKTLVVALLVAACFSCARSPAYKKEQGYYRSDMDYYNREGMATKRAEKLGMPKAKIFILAFYNETPLGGDEFGEFIGSELLRELGVSGKVVIPDDIRNPPSSKEFFVGDKIRLTPLVREGRKMGVSMLIVGRIKRIVFRKRGGDIGLLRQKKLVAAVDLDLRIFDISAEKENLFDEKSADSSTSSIQIFGGGSDDDIRGQRTELVQQALRNGARILAADVLRAIDKTAWEGRIAKISGNRIFVNAGRATGLNIGDILKVMTTGEDVYDPVTNAYMGRSAGQPKGTLEIIDFLGTDGAVSQIHSGGGFLENDVIRLY